MRPRADHRVQHLSAATTANSTDRTRPRQPSPLAQRPSATVLSLATDQKADFSQIVTGPQQIWVVAESSDHGASAPSPRSSPGLALLSPVPTSPVATRSSLIHLLRTLH